MIRWLRSLLAWRLVFETNSERYEENAVTGLRRIVVKPLPRGQMRAPPDSLWAEGFPRGETYRRMGPPPRPSR